jgi:hypothetical protein
MTDQRSTLHVGRARRSFGVVLSIAALVVIALAWSGLSLKDLLASLLN